MLPPQAHGLVSWVQSCAHLSPPDPGLKTGKRMNHRQAVRSLLLAAFILLPSTSIVGQSDADSEFSAGLEAYRGQAFDQAIEHFRNVVKADPSSSEAIRFMNMSQDSLVQMMMSENEEYRAEFKAFAMTILEASRSMKRDAVRDKDAAEALASKCLEGTYAERGKSIWKLGMTFGPFAVPPLVASLNSNDATRYAAIYALSRLGSDALPPLLAASSSPNSKVRLAVAQVLIEMGDARATARLAEMARYDEDAAINALCAGYVSTPVGESYIEQGDAYYSYDMQNGLMETENHGVRWVLDGSTSLYYDELEAGLVPLELAKECYAAANHLREPSTVQEQASKGMALVYAAEVALLRAVGEDNRAAEQFNAGLSLSSGALNLALGASLKSSNDVPIASVLIEMLDSPAAIHAIEVQNALSNSVPTLRFSAAISLANAGDVNSPGLLTSLLRASSLRGLRTVQIFSTNPDFSEGLSAELASNECTTLVALDANSGFTNLYSGLNIDAFVIQDPLPDTYARQLVRRIRAIGKYADVPIFVQANGSATGDIDDANVEENVTGSMVAASWGSLDVERTGYRRTAARAAEALAGMASRESRLVEVDLSDFVVLLGRTDDNVAIPIINALGYWGSASETKEDLMSVVGDDGKSNARRAAAARSVERIMASAPPSSVKMTSDDLNTLQFAMKAGGDLAQACAMLLGRGKAPHKSVKVSPK